MAVVDLWMRRDPATGRKVRTARYGSGRRWKAEWVEADGRRRSKTFETKDEAEANYAAVRADIHRGVYLDPEAGAITFRAYCERWIEGQDQAPLTRINNRARFEKHVYPYLGHLPLARIKPSTIQSWLTTLASLPPENRKPAEGVAAEDFRLAGTTRHRIFSQVATVLQAAVDDRIIGRNPAKARSVRRPRKDTAPAQPWAPERVAAVLEELPARWKPALLLAAGCGLRRGEVFGLAIDDIDWLRGVVHVRRQVLHYPSNRLAFALPKYGKKRDVPLPGYVKDLLTEYLAEFPARDVTLPWRELEGDPVTVPLLMSSRQGGAGNAGHFQTHVWRPACRRAGFEPTNRDGLHALRHTYASALLDGGESIIVVAARLGHSDPAFTLRTYAHLMPDTEQRTRDVAGDFMRSAIEGRPAEPGDGAAPAVNDSEPITHGLRTAPPELVFRPAIRR